MDIFWVMLVVLVVLLIAGMAAIFIWWGIAWLRTMDAIFGKQFGKHPPLLGNNPSSGDEPKKAENKSKNGPPEDDPPVGLTNPSDML